MRLIRAIALTAGLLLLASVSVSAQTASLLPNGEQQFADPNGVPYAGGSVYFYIPLTTTPKNTWQDPYETTLNSNPVILDSAGRATIYGAGQYRQVLTDQYGNTIWDKLTSASGLPAGPQAPVESVLTATSGTYGVPSGALYLTVRMCGGGGPGGGGTTGGTGSNGGTTSFGAVTALGGQASVSGAGGNPNGGIGGSGGSGSATLRIAGAWGSPGQYNNINGLSGGTGGSSPFGGAGAGGTNIVGGLPGAPGSCSGGGGFGPGPGGDLNSNGGGGAGEYVELLITSPLSSYTFAVGLGGTISYPSAGNGGSGVIIVTAFFL